jgi:acyl carrier protein
MKWNPLTVSDTRTRLVQCFAVVFPEIPAGQLPAAAVETTPGWDSVNAVVLLSVVEEEFEIGIPAEEMGRLTSFEAILGYLDGSR